MFYKEQNTTLASPNSGFFASKLQKTKLTITKKFTNNSTNKDKNQDLANKSLNSSSNSLNSNSSSSNFHSSTTSYSSSNLNDLNDFSSRDTLNNEKKKPHKFTTVQSSTYFVDVSCSNVDFTYS